MTDAPAPSPAAARRRALGGAALVIGTALLFTGSVMLARLVYDAGGSAVTVLAVRYVAGMILLFFWLTRRGGSPWLPWPQAWTALAAGLLVSSYAYGYLGAVQFIPVSLAVLIFYLNPLLVGLFAFAVDRRPLPPLRIAALLAGLLGVGLALNVSFLALDWRGLALAFWGAVGVALTVTLSQRLLRRISSLVLSFHVCVAGALVFGSLGLAAGGLALPHGASGWAALAALPVTFTAGTVCFYGAIALIGGVKTSTIMNAEPVFTVLGAVLLLHERFAPLQIAGALLVGLAILLVNLPARSAPEAPAPR